MGRSVVTCRERSRRVEQAGQEPSGSTRVCLAKTESQCTTCRAQNCAQGSAAHLLPPDDGHLGALLHQAGHHGTVSVPQHAVQQLLGSFHRLLADAVVGQDGQAAGGEATAAEGTPPRVVSAAGRRACQARLHAQAAVCQQGERRLWAGVSAAAEEGMGVDGRAEEA